MGGKLGIGIIVYAILTSVIGITIAISAHLIIKPGHRLKQLDNIDEQQYMKPSHTDLFTDVLR